MAFSIFEKSLANKAKGNLLPPVNTIASAGAFGAILGLATSGVSNFGRVRAGEISEQEAVMDTLLSGARSAATMAVASVASNIVRVQPFLGLAALAAVGVGVLVAANNSQQRMVAEAGAAEIEVDAEVAAKVVTE